jgi:hypothetical protein
MAEQRTTARPYLILYACDTCNNGQLKTTGKILRSFPPTFEHKCVTCGALYELSQPYPCVSWEIDGVEIGRSSL